MKKGKPHEGDRYPQGNGTNIFKNIEAEIIIDPISQENTTRQEIQNGDQGYQEEQYRK